MATKTAPKLSPAELADALRREQLMTVTAAADVLGIKPENFKRDVRDRLVGVPVAGRGRDIVAYFRSEVEALAAIPRSEWHNGSHNGSHPA